MTELKARHKTARGPVYDVRVISHERLKKLHGPKAPKGDHRLGLCESSLGKGKKNKIWINARLGDWQLCSISVHELLHAEFPQFEEWAINRLERSIMSMVRRSWRWHYKMNDKKKGRKK